MPVRTFVFVGPSLPEAEVRRILKDAIVLPPVAGGDLLRLQTEAGDRVVLIDGVYYHSTAVRHKEILALLNAGVRVYGAASMGALRAAELAPFGMYGMGAVYEAYRSGAIEGDDEVAVLHAPADNGYRPLSEAMVNVRRNIDAAQQAGIIGESTSRILIETCASVPFYQRTYPALVQGCVERGANGKESLRFKQWVGQNRLDIKREDAIGLLCFLSSQEECLSPSQHSGWQLAQTSFLHMWQERFAGEHIAGSGWVSDLEALTFCQLFATDYVSWRREAMFSVIATAYAEEQGLEVPGSEQLLTDFLGQNRLEREVALTDWLLAHALTLDELVEHLHAEACVQAVCDKDQLAAHRGNEMKDVIVRYARLCGLCADTGSAPEWTTRWLDASERAVLSEKEMIVTAAVRAFQIYPGIMPSAPLIRRLKLDGLFRLAQRGVLAARAFNLNLQVQHPQFTEGRLRSERIVSWFRQRWGVPEISPMTWPVRDRGFDGEADFLARSRRFYLLDRSSHIPQFEMRDRL